MVPSTSKSIPSESGLLDRLAISMAVICGIHCLVTPILLVALPIIATTFWVDENFHLWMLLLVIPTTTLAVWSGCRRHKDKFVLISAALGLGILMTALIAERIEHSHAEAGNHSHSTGIQALDDESSVPHNGAQNHLAGGGCCALHPAKSSSSNPDDGDMPAHAGSIPWHAALNTLGGLFLVAGHMRNFLLCRRDNCSHGEYTC